MTAMPETAVPPTAVPSAVPSPTHAAAPLPSADAGPYPPMPSPAVSLLTHPMLGEPSPPVPAQLSRRTLRHRTPGRHAAVPAGPAARYRDVVRVAGTMAGVAASSARVPLTGPRGRQRLVTCAAARTLTALGVRVEVHASPVAWPRTGPDRGPGLLVLTGPLCWLGDLALLTVLPAVPVASGELARSPLVGPLVRRAGAVLPEDGSSLADRVAELVAAGRSVTLTGSDPGHPAVLRAAVEAGATVCPVRVRYRGSGPGVSGEPAARSPWRDLAGAGSTRGLVIEVHLLPPVPPVDAVYAPVAAATSQDRVRTT
ncbi:hypothetical protein GB931_21400 [Modestobacter sp. I12A-02628]|uniref:Uncharacterized protein n=1 Tax=Goekera deserti TaxID=2497753 RepID=A0A7K3WAP7_9ACTN|nr:hypothetical protein [Goekera deserti]MPR00431.1 hypothetical protein [Goekera deserti]NDI49172.1 hypothetical protein [Goekera deserti]NEL52910.1 hypothetical protein [Goekera deserti]